MAATTPLQPVLERTAAEVNHAAFEDRFRGRKPVRIKGFAESWPAFQKWRDVEYLRTLLPPDEPVPVLVSKDNHHFFKLALCEERRMPYGAVLDRIFGGHDDQPRLYLRLDLLPSFHADITLPTELVYDAERDGAAAAAVVKPANCGVWLSTRGNITPLHFDLCHGFLVQIVGRKRWVFFDPDDYRNLYPAGGADPNPHSSRIALEKWLAGDADERKRFPRVADAEPFTCTLEPGDLMYTPPCWWHHVETLEPSISVLVPFDMRPTESLHPCAM